MKNSSHKSMVNKQCWLEIGVWSNVDNKCERLSEYIHCRNCPVFSDEGRRVFEKAPPAGYLSEWRKKLAITASSDSHHDVSVMVFRISEEWFSLPTACLEEVTEQRTIHRIPRNRNKEVEGIVNIAGEIQICYSLENILGIKHVSLAEENITIMGRFLVVLLGDKNYVFSVDQVSGLCGYAIDELQPPPATLEFEGSGMLLGVLNNSNNNVAVLDIALLQHRLEGINL
ncbi:MAG: chemotaxis protein CheW [Ectothiorhodospiraceae bacterium]|nr:chemotaxis protein CheW [Ectothiorhodospiraceae bacterium]